MTILALDIGDKRIGVAVSDPSEEIALPLEVIHRTNQDTDCIKIIKIIEEYKVRLMIAGLPRSLDGQLKTQAEKVQKYVGFLRTKISIPIEYWNEWMSTKEAEAVMIAGKVRREDRKKLIDKLAASLILNGYLQRIKQEKKITLSSEPRG